MAKILVIEDDPGASRLASYALEFEGYKVITAMNGLDGLKKAQNDGPDLIILDVMLPGIDGFEICRRLRTDEKYKDIPIIMLSAKVQESDKATGLKVGANEYLTKPIDPHDLITHVKNLL